MGSAQAPHSLYFALGYTHSSKSSRPIRFHCNNLNVCTKGLFRCDAKSFKKIMSHCGLNHAMMLLVLLVICENVFVHKM